MSQTKEAIIKKYFTGDLLTALLDSDNFSEAMEEYLNEYKGQFKGQDEDLTSSIPLTVQLFRNAKTMEYKEYASWVKSRCFHKSPSVESSIEGKLTSINNNLSPSAESELDKAKDEMIKAYKKLLFIYEKAVAGDRNVVININSKEILKLRLRIEKLKTK
jgi:hypothetical protein